MLLSRKHITKKADSACKARCRNHSYSILTTAAAERVDLPCRGGGTIVLNVHHPHSSGSYLGSGPPTVLLHLHRGPLLHKQKDDAVLISALRSSLPLHIVQVNYQANKEHQYPHPIHDVLTAYDWVHEHLLPKRSIQRTGRSSHVGRLAVSGELLGGGLAAMLALTECHSGQPGVVAAALNNPIIDWVFEEPPALNKPKATYRTQPQIQLTPSDLLSLRSDLFRKPEHYFDPFASPLLFMRTAGVDIPALPPTTPMDEFEQLIQMDRDDFHRQQLALSSLSNKLLETEIEIKQEQNSTRKPKVSRKFPNKSLGLDLPSFHISSGRTSPLDDQGREFVKQLRKSVARQLRAKQSSSTDFGHKVLFDHEEELEEQAPAVESSKPPDTNDRVEHVRSEGLGLWDDTPAGQKRIADLTAWLRQKLY